MEKYEIVFSSELEADVNEFVRKWNANAEYSKLGIASAEKATKDQHFVDPSVNDVIVFLNMNPIASSVAGSMILEAIKLIFKGIGYAVNVKKDKWERLSVEHLPLKKKK